MPCWFWEGRRRIPTKRPYLLKKRGRVWYYRLADEKTFHSTEETNIGPAQQIAMNEAAERSRPGAPRRDPPRLRDFARGFFNQEGPWVRYRKEADFSFSPVLSRMRNSQLERYIFPVFGDLRLPQIKAQAVRRWMLDLVHAETGRPLAGGTKNHILITFSLVLQEACLAELISHNPLQQAGRAANRYRRRDAFSWEEIHQLFPRDRTRLEQIWGEFYWAALAFLALTAGLRSQEVRALRWRHVAWPLRGLILLEAVKAYGELGDLKSGDQRGILLPGRALAFLRVWRLLTPFPEEQHFIFYGEDGDHFLDKTKISDRFRAVLRRQGFDLQNRNLVFHSLRHTYNTRMRNILSEAMLHYMIGHRSTAMTDRYDQGTPAERLLEFLPERRRIGQAWN